MENKGNSNFAEGVRFTPHLYDNNTKIREFTNAGIYWKAGKIVIGMVYGNNLDFSGVSTLIAIGNMPCHVVGGSVYINNISGQGGNKVFQQNTSQIIIRPNTTSNDIPNGVAGVVSIAFYGYSS